MSFVVTLRSSEPRLADDRQLVLRLGTDSDVDQTVKASLGHYFSYQQVVADLGIGGGGALTLSVYLFDDGQPVEAFRAGPFQRWFRTTTVGRVRDAGIAIWPTDVSVEGQPLPMSASHADLVVSTRSDVLPAAYAAADKSERRRLRELLRPDFEHVLSVFDPAVPFDGVE